MYNVYQVEDERATIQRALGRGRGIHYFIHIFVHSFSQIVDERATIQRAFGRDFDEIAK